MTVFAEKYKFAEQQAGISTRLCVDFVQCVGDCLTATLHFDILYAVAALRRLGYSNLRRHLYFVAGAVYAHRDDKGSFVQVEYSEIVCKKQAQQRNYENPINDGGIFLYFTVHFASSFLPPFLSAQASKGIIFAKIIKTIHIHFAQTLYTALNFVFRVRSRITSTPFTATDQTALFS